MTKDPISIADYGQQMLALMQAHPWGAQILDFVKTNSDWAPAIVFIFAFLESLAVVGVFVPATVVLIAVGALVGATDIQFWPVWMGAAAGALGGDFVSYWFGFRFKDHARRVWPLSHYPEMYDRGDRFFRKWGVWGLFIGRFFGPVRGMVPLVAGVFRMPVMLFTVANIASAMIWAFALLAPGFAAFQLIR